jgi:hypothetical protein
VDGDSQTAEEEKKEFALDLNDEEQKYLAEKLTDFKFEYAARGGIIEKNSMMKLMKLIGDFSKMRSKDISKEAQEKRLGHYAKEYDQYVDVILETMNREEESFNYCTTAILAKLKISQEVYMRSEQALIMDPASQMELLQKGIENEDSSVEVPAELNKEKTIEILKESNDKSFEVYKHYSESVKKKDPYLTPVVIS